ncbi:MAG: sugar ABC transporter substrate-binding protein [Eubacterium sp.]|nr:sugar ABC transporter substrate-binding protein [Eubacterium sp.]
MKLKQLTAGVLATLMTAGLLAGCGGSSSGSSSQASSAGSAAGSAAESTAENSGGSTDAIDLKIWDSKQKDGIQTICDEWTEQSGVKVNVEVVDWDNYWTLLEAGASGGEMPDVFWMHSNYAQKYMDAELLLKLNDYIDKDDAIDLGNYYEDIVKLYQQEDGTQYAIPKDYDTIALWYNKKMFDDAGLDYPDNTWTWEKMHEVGQKLNKEDGSQYGLVGNTDANQEGYYNIIYSYGGYVINDAHDKSGYDDPKTIEAMNMYGQIIKDCMAPQSVMAETGNADLFTSNTAAMGMFGSWYVASFKENEGASNWGIAELPYHDANGNGQADEGERVSIYNGLGWAASADTEDPDTVYSLLSYLGSKEGQTRQAELGVTMSAYEGTSDAWKSSTDVVDLAPYLDEATGDATLVIMPYSRSTTWAEDAKQQFVAAWQDPSQMESVCKSIAETMNAQLAQE